MIRRLAAGVAAFLIAVASLGAFATSAAASTPSPSPGASSSLSSSPSALATPTVGRTEAPPPTYPPGPPGWLLILIGVAILIFTFTGGATRLAKRFQQQQPPSRP